MLSPLRKFCRRLVPANACKPWLAASALLTGSLAASPVQASTTLVPSGYVTTNGTDSGQAAATSIDLLDESGTTSVAAKYLGLRTSPTVMYAGYRVYTLPAAIAPASVTALTVRANYMGPVAATQTWTWLIYDWVQGKYIPIGTNQATLNSGTWTALRFGVRATIGNCIRASDGQIRIQTISSNSAGNAAIDFEGVDVTTAAAVVGISVSPASATVVTGRTQQFTATVTGTTNPAVTWQVNGVTGGSAGTGLISASGLYTAPAQVPTGGTVTVKAIAQADTAKTATATVTVTQPTSGTTYYVATTGSDTNPGTIALPWRTIQHAANSVAAGNTVLIRAGVYHEQVLIRRSGSATAGAITFSNALGEAAILDGTGVTATGQSGLIDILNQSYITVQGLEIRNFQTASANNIPAGVFIAGAGTNISILANHVHDIVTSVTTANGNAFGIAVYGTNGTQAISNLVIAGNEVDHLITGQSESVVVNGNVQNFQIVNNRVHDNNNIGIDAIGFEGTSPSTSTDQARDGVISGNTVYNITSVKNPAYGNSLGADGIYVEGGTRITVERNVVHHTDLGIELASEHGGKSTSYVVARSNVIYNSYMVGISIGGSEATNGGTDHCSIVNNTLYNNDINQTGTGEFSIQNHASNNVFDNNILYAGVQGLFVNSQTVSAIAPATLNNNLYYTSAGAANAEWVWNNVTRTGLAAFRAATGNDGASQFADPLFASLSVPNFQVAATSPAVNAGVNLGTPIVGALDLGGNPRVGGANIDIGAYER